MTNERYIELEKSMTLPLTQEELDLGWHWCYDWDGMLIGPGMDALDGCTCGRGNDGCH